MKKTTWELLKEAEFKAGLAKTDAEYAKWTKEYHRLTAVWKKEQ